MANAVHHLPSDDLLDQARQLRDALTEATTGLRAQQQHADQQLDRIAEVVGRLADLRAEVSLARRSLS
jgi:ribosome assembly protein YihI (activator of Der GTPase)